MIKSIKFPCGGKFEGDRESGGGISCLNKYCYYCYRPWDHLEAHEEKIKDYLTEKKLNQTEYFLCQLSIILFNTNICNYERLRKIDLLVTSWHERLKDDAHE